MARLFFSNRAIKREGNVNVAACFGRQAEAAAYKAKRKVRVRLQGERRRKIPRLRSRWRRASGNDNALGALREKGGGAGARRCSLHNARSEGAGIKKGGPDGPPFFMLNTMCCECLRLDDRYDETESVQMRE